MILLVGVVIFGGLAYSFSWLDFSSPDQKQNEQTQTSNGSQIDSSDWETYNGEVDSELSFNISHPAGVSVSQAQGSIYEIKYVGPNSEADTEITDGYYASIMFERAADLEEYTNSQNPTSRIQTLTSNGREALTYVTESELGSEVTHITYYISPEDDQLVDIIYSIHVANSATYQDTLFRILETLTFHNQQDEMGNTTTLKIAMLDYEGIGKESNGPMRGCNDRIVFVEQRIPYTNTPLNSALEALFAFNDTEVGGWQNFIAKTNDTLFFEKATLDNGVASIYLTGELSGLAGVCDNPRAKIQIEETALQFDTVDSVKIYLNGEETELQPNGKGE